MRHKHAAVGYGRCVLRIDTEKVYFTKTREQRRVKEKGLGPSSSNQAEKKPYQVLEVFVWHMG